MNKPEVNQKLTKRALIKVEIIDVVQYTKTKTVYFVPSFNLMLLCVLNVHQYMLSLFKIN